jgi:FtsZ-binding cell division protein ZapB
MPEPEAPDTPDTPTPAADTTDWRTRYENLQPEYTRATQALKDAESVWEDEQAVLGRLQERYPHLFEADEDEETPPPPGEDDPVAPIRSELDEVKQWKAQVESERAEARFARDLATELGDDKVPEKATDWIKDRTAALGNNPKALKQAVEEYRAIADDIRGPTRRGAPTPPQPGKAGEPKYDPKDRNARRARMAAGIEAANQQ